LGKEEEGKGEDWEAWAGGALGGMVVEEKGKAAVVVGMVMAVKVGEVEEADQEEVVRAAEVMGAQEEHWADLEDLVGLDWEVEEAEKEEVEHSKVEAKQ